MEFGFIGKKDNHDIWGYFFRPTPINKTPWFFGRNCCILQTNIITRNIELNPDSESISLMNDKMYKIYEGYKEIELTKIIELWPTFEQDVQDKLFIEILTGKIS